jgi:hypothetical protein
VYLPRSPALVLLTGLVAAGSTTAALSTACSSVLVGLLVWLARVPNQPCAPGDFGAIVLMIEITQHTRS